MSGDKYDETAGVKFPDLLGQLHAIHIAVQINVEKIDSCILAVLDRL